jgi:hypothetical protein
MAAVACAAVCSESDMAEMTRFQRLIGGLLGENMEGMTEEQRRRLAREGGTAAILGMLSGSGLLGGLEGLRTRRKEQATEAEAARRVSEAQAEMPRITGRLLGGTAGALESLPGGEGGPLTARYRQAPQEALARLYGTQAGRTVAQMAPDLAKLATEATLGRTVGGVVYNPVTGKVINPAEAQVQTLPPAEVAALGLPRGTLVQRDPSGELKILREPPRVAVGGGVGVGGAPRATGAPGAPSGGKRFQTLTAEEVAAAGFPEGTVVQRDNQTDALKVLSAVPATQRTGEAGRATAVTRVDNIANRIISQMDKVATGGMLGATGILSRVFDSQDAKLFETYRQQLSTALRAALRIPGEGALSDRDLALYGLTLPDIGQSRENNIAIIESLKEQVRLAAGQDIPRPTGPTAGATSGPPPGVTAQEWAAMTPEERELFK